MERNNLTQTPIILDCDPGVDDAIAILLANKIKTFDLRAITTVAGNVEVEKTTHNALRILNLIGAEIPVFPGADKPIANKQVTAKAVHGNDGLGGVDLPDSDQKAETVPAWDLIHQEAVACEGNLEIIAVGPLTNLALAFQKYNDLPSLLKRIVIMGGAAKGGNVTPSAEFNIYADPEAADRVFTSGIPVYMCGLDVTRQACFTSEDLDAVAELGSQPAVFFRDVLQDALAFVLNHGDKGICMHDPLTVLYAADDSIFETHRVGIRVETEDHLTRGKTITDLYSEGKMEPNAYIITKVDLKKLRLRIMELMAEYS